MNESVNAVEAAGGIVRTVRMPDFARINVVSQVVQLAEFASLHVGRNDQSMFGPDVWALLEQGRMITGSEYVNAQRLRTLFRHEMDALWQEVDVLITPTTPFAAPEVQPQNVTGTGWQRTVRMASTRLVRGINLLGEPALSMPCGKTETGMPAGLQLIAAPFAEAKLLQFAKTLEGMLERQT